MRTAGTSLYFADPVGCVATQVGCPTSISGLDAPVSEIEITCLGDDARRFEAGLAEPGTASFVISFEPQDESHRRLLALKKSGDTVRWALGLSESQDAPTSAADSNGDCDFTLPATRSWFTFDGFVNSFSLEVALNGVYTVTVGIRMSGDADFTEATA